MTHETVMILRRTGTSAFQDLQQHPQHHEYEISSLTKTFTALLLADAIRRGEVTADTKASPLLPLGDIPLAEVTLAGLASHRSGLSAQGMQAIRSRSLRPSSATASPSRRTWMAC